MTRYILTGGPGAGKSCLLTALGQSGYSCSEEISRQLILEETAKGSGCLPWTDFSGWAGRVLERMIAAYKAVEQEPVFFDRGIPDIVAYLRAARLPVEERYEKALRNYPYARTVFLLPPWEEIYVQDPARWQTFREAETLSDFIRDTYQQAGYTIINIPRGTIEQRVRYLQGFIIQPANKNSYSL